MNLTLTWLLKKKNLQKFFFSTFFLCFGFYRLRIERNRIESKYQWFDFLTIGSVRFAIKNRNQINRFGLDTESFRDVVRMMILKQSKRRRTLFRRRKFDVLIRSDLAKNLFTKNVLYYINKISFSYFFVWIHYFII
jgi:hypothetical protein